MSQCLGRRAAPRGKAENFKFPHDPLQRQTQTIADAHVMRRFYAFRIKMDLAAVDGGRCQAARFEKPGMPEPFVEPMVLGFFRRCHK